jgi:serine/threonine protein kinase
MLAYTETDSEYSLYLEYVTEATLLPNLVLESHTPVEDEDDLKSYTKDALLALEHCHSHCIIHGDVKLENMLAHRESGKKI